MAKTKSKAKTKKVRTRKIAVKQKTYPAYLLGIVLVVMLLGQSALMLNATPADWQAGVAILDVSDGVTAMSTDLQLALEPMRVTMDAVSEFYNQSALAAMQIFDISDTKPMVVVEGISGFYTQAGRELAALFDLSNYLSTGQPQVAGASVWR